MKVISKVLPAHIKDDIMATSDSGIHFKMIGWEDGNIRP